MSNESSSNTASGCIGFCGLLTIAFIVLKLLGKITWSWWWVLSPSLIPLAIVLAVLIIVALAAAAVSVLT